ncbi:4'-phosphopantetheinyl transferase family protein [Streptomyces sp. CS057]|uniref:4'-phosphopantetheinyl transferase family protein n=1 Tax=Streptomyces sp. CS057 TaxID=1982764 RepID=UPI000B6D059A|nr:4'-phosphopantetheinyl transferase superfamily protein [Streptomyces sp. CS057]OWA21112.1 4-phosphopantetheinyl transferase [Streptomyces sp. CS057]
MASLPWAPIPPDPERGAAAVALVATTAEVLAHPELDERLLAPWERRRLAGIRVPARRDDVVAARLLLRLCASRVTGLPPAAVEPAQRCPGCGRDGHGRPYLPDHPELGVSYSHADGLAAAAVGPGPVGIDVEPLARRPGPLSVLRRMLPKDEVDAARAGPDPGPALLRLWVRREALFKAGFEAGFEAGRDDVRLTAWTDHRRAAVVALAGADGALAPALSSGPAPLPLSSGPAPPSGR